MTSSSWLAVAALAIACGGQITTTTDGGTQPDASDDGGKCIDLEPTSFDTSCNVTSDCVQIAAGTFCAGYNCSCPSAAINASSQDAYQAQLSTIPHGPGICSCPLLGSPKCISAQCVFCPNPATKPSTFPPGCPTSECEQAGGTCKPVSGNQCMGGGAPIGTYDCPSGQGCCN